MIDLRGLATDAAFMAAAQDVLGVDSAHGSPAPPPPGATCKVLWLSVDQWLILSPRTQGA